MTVLSADFLREYLDFSEDERPEVKIILKGGHVIERVSILADFAKAEAPATLFVSFPDDDDVNITGFIVVSEIAAIIFLYEHPSSRIPGARG